MKITRDLKRDLFGGKVESRLLDCIEWGIHEQLTVNVEDKRKKQPVMLNEIGNLCAEVKTQYEYEISVAAKWLFNANEHEKFEFYHVGPKRTRIQ